MDSGATWGFLFPALLLEGPDPEQAGSPDHEETETG